MLGKNLAGLAIRSHNIDNISVGRDGNVYLFYNAYDRICKISGTGQLLSSFQKRENTRVVWRSPQKAYTVLSKGSRNVDISVENSESGSRENCFSVITGKEIARRANVFIEMIDNEGNLYALYRADEPDSRKLNIIKVTPSGDKVFEIPVESRPSAHYYSNGSLRVSRSGDIYKMYSDKEHFWIEKILIRY